MFIGYWLYATFYSQALCRNLKIKLEAWIIAPGLFLPIGNYKNYMGRETIENSATRALSTASPSRSYSSFLVAQHPPGKWCSFWAVLGIRL